VENTALEVLARILRQPGKAALVEGEIDLLPGPVREGLIRRLLQMPEEGTGNGRKGAFLSADFILRNEWPEPVWIIPGIIPAGLTVLGGAPKLGKSWFALQMAQAVAAGGFTLGRRIPQGAVLYLALEDPPRRLKERMLRQHWVLDLPCDFLPVGRFQETIGDLRNGGAQRLSNHIEAGAYRLVVIDTLSRSISGDQNDAQEMTTWLAPIQEMAHMENCAIVLLDHHNKVGSEDAVRDILGSTAKGAMADTVIGLYRERGKSDARLTVTGREVEEQTVNIRFDQATGCWQLDANPLAGLTSEQADLVVRLEAIEPATLRQVCDALGKDYAHSKGAVLNRLGSLQEKGKVFKVGDVWRTVQPEVEDE